jgi:hypothetical protein
MSNTDRIVHEDGSVSRANAAAAMQAEFSKVFENSCMMRSAIERFAKRAADEALEVFSANGGGSSTMKYENEQLKLRVKALEEELSAKDRGVVGVLNAVRRQLGIEATESVILAVTELKRKADDAPTWGEREVLNKVRDALGTPPGVDVVQHAANVAACVNERFDLIQRLQNKLNEIRSTMDR